MDSSEDETFYYGSYGSASNSSSNNKNTTDTSNSNPTGSNNSAYPRKPFNSNGMLLAAGYIGIWTLILIIFRIIYVRYRNQKRKKTRGGAEMGKHSLAWFGPNPERDAYEELLIQFQEKTSGNTEDGDGTTITQSIIDDMEEQLRKALLKRAMTDLKRAWSLGEDKDSVYKLMRQSDLSEEMWAEFKEAEQAMQVCFVILFTKFSPFFPLPSLSLYSFLFIYFYIYAYRSKFTS